ncbi:hypothetical protein HY490_05695 [Candidatus Woesearchaeota archaeon]|nr:hypothetical protein [Candidatus Woesearchaeota archaeon]
MKLFLVLFLCTLMLSCTVDSDAQEFGTWTKIKRVLGLEQKESDTPYTVPVVVGAARPDDSSEKTNVTKGAAVDQSDVPLTMPTIRGEIAMPEDDASDVAVPLNAS